MHSMHCLRRFKILNPHGVFAAMGRMPTPHPFSMEKEIASK